MITSHVEFNECPTVAAPLPPLFPCCLKHLLSCDILRIIAVMGGVLADRAGVCAAGHTRGSLATDVNGSDKR